MDPQKTKRTLNMWDSYCRSQIFYLLRMNKICYPQAAGNSFNPESRVPTAVLFHGLLLPETTLRSSDIVFNFPLCNLKCWPHRHLWVWRVPLVSYVDPPNHLLNTEFWDRQRLQEASCNILWVAETSLCLPLQLVAFDRWYTKEYSRHCMALACYEFKRILFSVHG